MDDATPVPTPMSQNRDICCGHCGCLSLLLSLSLSIALSLFLLALPQLMVFPSSRGGVPVLRRPSGKLNLSRVSASPTEGGSTCALSLRCLPAQYHSCVSGKIPAGWSVEQTVVSWLHTSEGRSEEEGLGGDRTAIKTRTTVAMTPKLHTGQNDRAWWQHQEKKTTDWVPLYRRWPKVSANVVHNPSQSQPTCPM